MIVIVSYKRGSKYTLCLALLTAMLLAFVPRTFSQSLSDTLKEVRIKGQHKAKISNDDKLNTFAPGQKVTSIDSQVLQQYQLQSIANLLTQQVPVFVKSYGFNGLATLNFRGASAAQSQVLWNGVPLQNAALGIADVSTMPIAFLNKVNIVYGGSAALWGSGNVGGALLLENDPPVFDSNIRNNWSVSLGCGSFGQYSGGAKISLSTKRLFVSANALAQSASNNFRYTAQNNNSSKMPNSELHSLGFMLNGAYLLSNKSVLGFSAWYQHFDREIPPALFENGSVKMRLDRSFRFLVDWNKQEGRNTTYFKSSFISDELTYNDNSVYLSSHNASYQFYNEIGWRRKLNKNHTFLLFAPVNLSWMNVPAHGFRSQVKAGLSAAWAASHFADRLQVSLQASGQAINEDIVFLPGINASYALTDWLSIRGNIQRTFRAPTLNEWYYAPGGNPSLEPEQGWSEDAGYALKTNTEKPLSLTHDVSVFNRVIKDWIIWFGGAIWTPHNLALVHSRGVETENMLRWKRDKWQFHLRLNTAYILSTTAESYMLNDGSIDKQIPYAPRYNGQLNLGFTTGALYFNYNHTYTGYRFTTTDESGWIEPYNTGNLQLSYAMKLQGDYLINISAQCNNIWNQEYIVVAQRPMPGTNWLLGVNISSKK